MIKRLKKAHTVPTPSKRQRLQLPNHYCSSEFTYNHVTGKRELNPNYMPPKRQKDNGIWGVVGRGYYYSSRQGNIFCTGCNHTFSPERESRWILRQRHKPQACGNCGSKAILFISSEIRVPKQSANARVWRNFKAMFIDHLIESAKKSNPNWPEPRYTEAELEAQWLARDAYDKQQQAQLEAEEQLNNTITNA